MSTCDRMIVVIGLRCEGMERPSLAHSACPRFSWRLVSESRGAEQTAYEVRVAKRSALKIEEDEAWSSGRVESSQSQWVTLEGLRLEAQTRYEWKTRVWDGMGRRSEWSEPEFFETSLFDREWAADWICDGKVVETQEDPPARYFRKTFSLAKRPIRATLYLSAYGLVEPWINGKTITDDLFLPGWPDYRKRNFYVSYDVLDRLKEGVNTIGLVLGDGWYSGTLFLDHQYNATPKVSGWIEILNADGSLEMIRTDHSWEHSTGPILSNGLYFGESYDARLEEPDWACPLLERDAWEEVVVVEKPDGELEPRISQAVRRIEELVPVSKKKIREGAFLYDLGQNMVGWVRLKVEAQKGDEIVMRFGEMLEADGQLHTKNLREAEATARYIAKGDEIEIWEPRFTFFGFRYVEVSGLEELLEDAITGVVIHSELPRTGYFECSKPMLNKLYRNTLWGQKGNFLELPTDCPQRDERLGWTGDAQVFCDTGMYNMAAGSFYRQWMGAVRDSFEDGPEGGYGSVAPFTGFARGSAGWADAGVIVPWIVWKHTGDRRILEENFATMCRWVNLLRDSASGGLRVSKEAWGDWLAPWFEPKEAPTPYQLIATAYYAVSTRITADVARLLGESERYEEYDRLFGEIRSAFQREYIDSEGRIKSDEQTAYLLALSFGLVSEELRPEMIAHLKRAIHEKADHLSTGFIGTPLLATVLSEIDLTELAYTVVQQESYPGWLYSVKNGATTIWERWDSWTPEVGFNPGGMNSFNHYAYGSVVSWFYGTIGGLKPLVSAAGWSEFEIAPEPGGGLEWANASVETPYGVAESNWKIERGRFVFDCRIPPNTRAKVSFSAISLEAVTLDGEATYEGESRAKFHFEEGRAKVTLPSGLYHFESLVEATMASS